jgi:hypothetical protein
VLKQQERVLALPCYAIRVETALEIERCLVIETAQLVDQ